ncbi:Na(+)-translocating NADH-quinone reductase subunit C [bacterium]|nr:Na(+)-translocating NADH-quinone reductase subunit C [bacterium]
MKNESTMKILGVALVVCLVCAILVATTAVTLKPIQKQNQETDRLKNILSAGGLLTDEGQDLHLIYKQNIRAEIIDLEQGSPVPEADLPDGIQPDRFDIREIAGDATVTRPLAPDEDLAQIKQVPKYMVVYHVIRDSMVQKHIFPVYGKGLWSTMYGFIALAPDLRTIKAFTFYDHGETPGLGGEVDNPRWKKYWIDKLAFNASGELKIEVIKGQVDAESPEAAYQVDGLSGSTLTTRGVHNLVRFWLGEQGWGPYIRNLKQMNPAGQGDA